MNILKEIFMPLLYVFIGILALVFFLPLVILLLLEDNTKLFKNINFNIIVLVGFELSALYVLGIIILLSVLL
mgnify:CR=1 FL=1